jgi:hypothetical protein
MEILNTDDVDFWDKFNSKIDEDISIKSSYTYEDKSNYYGTYKRVDISFLSNLPKPFTVGGDRVHIGDTTTYRQDKKRRIYINNDSMYGKYIYTPTLNFRHADFRFFLFEGKFVLIFDHLRTYNRFDLEISEENGKKYIIIPWSKIYKEMVGVKTRSAKAVTKKVQAKTLNEIKLIYISGILSEMGYEKVEQTPTHIVVNSLYYINISKNDKTKELNEDILLWINVKFKNEFFAYERKIESFKQIYDAFETVRKL